MRARFRPLPRAFYARPVLEVARDVIGTILVRCTNEGTVAGRIVEAEAYRGPHDRAAHTYGGRRTPRTEAMWGEAGHAYVFFVYGAHFHFNLVTGRVGDPEAVLIRAVEPLLGVELMAARRANREPLADGPGKLCQAFSIDKRDYGSDLCKSRFLFVAEGTKPSRVGAGPRIGIDYAGSWAKRPWRFFDPSSSCFRSARKPARKPKVRAP